MVELKAWQESRAGKMLVLGTANDRPNSVLLESLKQLAEKAGLSCGRCDGCARLKEPGYRGGCMEFTLHRFRRTYLTALLRSGVDVRTVQRLAGHSDLEVNPALSAPCFRAGVASQNQCCCMVKPGIGNEARSNLALFLLGLAHKLYSSKFIEARALANHLNSGIIIFGFPPSARGPNGALTSTSGQEVRGVGH